MTDLEILDPPPARETERVAEPAKGWRNRFRLNSGTCIIGTWTSTCLNCGHVDHAENGTDFLVPHCQVFPSRDVAETTARDEADVWKDEFTYIGPEPV